MKMSLIAIIGVAVLVVSTIGFGASLSTNPGINRIGASDNQAVAAARGNVTALAWTEEVNSSGNVATKQIIFTVGNEDTSNAHSFEVCAVLEAPALTYQPAAGAPPACNSTSSIAASAKLTLVGINFTNTVEVSDIANISFSIEELN
ncbi:Hypothetical protein Nlim_0100 [Candidatus Nitrosarchaeum limnium SFB1]|jgi:hypothetical protein|uniref:Uncharacterized protein n=1 Tax=Candidatus Nitrosarchaeum limnium SFB1 TaxID=886738 RepID=F3KI09_9ARCH|nr:Hypothetical protein Nlim_0100 [Candidatus Nitrosarchaeum limnium SFB1]